MGTLLYLLFWILFLVISFILNKRTKGGSPRRREWGPPFFPELEEGENMKRTSDHNPQPDPRESCEPYDSRKFGSAESQAAEPPAAQSWWTPGQSAKEGFVEGFADRVLVGVIFSEILAPPVSMRLRNGRFVRWR